MEKKSIKKLLTAIEVGVGIFIIIFALNFFVSLPKELHGVEYWGTTLGVLIKYYQEQQSEKKQELQKQRELIGDVINEVKEIRSQLETLEQRNQMRHEHLKSEFEGDVERISSILDFLDIRELMPIILSLISLKDQSMKNIVVLPSAIASRLNREANKQKTLINLLKAKYQIGDEEITDFEEDFLENDMETMEE